MKKPLRWPLLGLMAATALLLVFLASCQTALSPSASNAETLPRSGVCPVFLEPQIAADTGG
jgi:hypothetical protein